MKIFRFGFGAILLTLFFCGAAVVAVAAQTPPPPQQQQQQQQQRPVSPTPTPPPRAPDVPYVPTREKIVEAMLELAGVTKNDTIYDLGSGDGRIVIMAAQKYGAKGVGVDINPERVREANANAARAKVTDKVKFIEGDLFETDFSKASVVTLYLLPEVNLRLRPKLFEQLKPGTRVVSHSFDMGDWEPEKAREVEGAIIYLWTIPAKKPATGQK